MIWFPNLLYTFHEPSSNTYWGYTLEFGLIFFAINCAITFVYAHVAKATNKVHPFSIEYRRARLHRLMVLTPVTAIIGALGWTIAIEAIFDAALLTAAVGILYLLGKVLLLLVKRIYSWAVLLRKEKSPI